MHDLEALPPTTESELLARARRLAGHCLGDIASIVRQAVPLEPRRAKGWTGRVLETILGASATSRAEPDFKELGVELKSIPVDARGRARESTFVASAPLGELPSETWSTSAVRRKLDRVLFIPIEAAPDLPIAVRRVGSPLLWTPSAEEWEILRRDWEDIAELAAAGYLDSVTGHRGVALQMRPKGRNSRTRRWGVDGEGDVILTAPRAFYLRAAFTSRLIRRSFVALAAKTAASSRLDDD